MSCRSLIGYLIPEFPGQTHSFFWREIEELSKLDIDVVLFSTRKPKDALATQDWAAEAKEKTGYLYPLDLADYGRAVIDCLVHPSVVSLVLLSSGGAITNRLRRLSLIPFASKLHRLTKAKGIKHVHVHSCANSAYIATLAKCFGSCKYSLTLHNPLGVYGEDQSLKWRRARFAIVITQKIYEEVCRELAGHLPPQVLIAPMGVDLPSFTRRTPYPVGETHPARIFSCCRLNRCKGIEDLLDAIVILRKSGIQVQLRIAGEDDDGGSGYRKILEAKIRDAQLQDSVELLGSLGHIAVRDELEAAHIFVLASHAEPLGVAFMEAMAMELPVIGTNAGGVPELIDHGDTGWLVEPRCPEGLAEAIASLASDPQRCMELGRNARLEIERNWTSQRSARAIAEALSTS
ncbi:exopolysaccharide biosynthesis GT4 family glycosyltransferase EpsE [Allorhodopirellula heiligendammensis]|uniref:Glycogen synthase n=1 Tax=Allorhodopirellula heiligendammensis TaxID=2714739 RepID=A0A5C6C1Q7_9BACT|nr:exopolysaccharide biosynthesis GT4 family glycosyltransferase EpsE [Allorhodopirellula heiligendammensis]TWU18082.1 Glycogen synthase [Allorhodopirellula heiligendammensis]